MVMNNKLENILEEVKTSILEDFEVIHEIVEENNQEFTQDQKVELILTILGYQEPTPTDHDRIVALLNIHQRIALI